MVEVLKITLKYVKRYTIWIDVECDKNNKLCMWNKFECRVFICNWT